MIDVLAPVVRFEMGASIPGFRAVAPYIRGIAYLQTKQAAAATTEFLKILYRRGLVGDCFTGALAHLGLARAYALAGDTAKSRTTYQDFLALWKDATPTSRSSNKLNPNTPNSSSKRCRAAWRFMSDCEVRVAL